MQAESNKLEAGMPRFFCAYAFCAAFLNQEGKAFPCCHTEEQARVRGLEGIGLENGLKAAWNSPLLRETRRQMMAGARPEICAHCIQLEDSGAKSLRQELNEGLLPLVQEGAREMLPDGALPSSPSILDLQQGNHCNLKCRMCGPANSVKLIEEHTEIIGSSLESFRQNFWLLNREAVHALLDGAPNVDELKVVGGEPLLSPDYLFLLQELIRRGRAREIMLTLNTNLTHLNEELRQAVGEFRGLRLFVSLEGAGEVNDFIRFPSKFAIIDKNIRVLCRDPAAWNLELLQFNTTVQAYNLFGLVDLFRYLKGFPELEWFPRLSILTEPQALSVRVIAKKERLMVAEELDRFGAELKPEWRERLGFLTQYLRAATTLDLKEEFLRRHEIHNRHRRQQTPYSIPSLIDANQSL